jgi:hypothetical protein
MLLGPFVIPIGDFVAGKCDSARALVGIHFQIPKHGMRIIVRGSCGRDRSGVDQKHFTAVQEVVQYAPLACVMQPLRI